MGSKFDYNTMYGRNPRKEEKSVPKILK